MRAWLTINGVEFVTDEWPMADERGMVFSARLRPVGTRPPGLEWWFSEGRWEGDNPAPEYLVEVERVEIERGGDGNRIEADGFAKPLLGHPGEVRRIKTTDGDLLVKRLDADRERFGGYGNESFKLSEGKGGICAELVPPFFNKEASFNKEEGKEPPGAEAREKDDIATFVRFLVPDDGDAREAGVASQGWWGSPKCRTRKKFRDEAVKWWKGAFGQLKNDIASAKQRNCDEYERRLNRRRKRRHLVYWLLGASVVLGLVLWGAWKFDGAQAAAIRKLTQEEKFGEAARKGEVFFLFRGQTENALKANKREQEKWLEDKSEAYEDALRERRWQVALALGVQIEHGGGKKPEEWEDVGRLLDVQEEKTKADEAFRKARQSRSVDDAKEAAEKYRKCLSLVNDGMSQLAPVLESDIRRALGQAEAWGVQAEMEGHEKAGRWDEAKDLAERLRGSRGADGENQDAAERVLGKYRDFGDRLQNLGTLANNPAAYYAELESLGDTYGEASVVSRLAAGGGNAFGTAMRDLLKGGILSARKAGKAVPGFEREVHWVEMADGAGMEGLELLLGWLRYYGVGCTPDREISAGYFGRAAEGEKRGSSGAGAFMLGAIRASQGNRDAAFAAMKKAEGKGVREATVVLSGSGQSLTSETLRAAATNLPTLRTAVALDWLERGRGAEGLDLLRKTVRESGHYPPAELWLSAMEGVSNQTYYQKNLAPGAPKGYPRPFNLYPPVLSPTAELSRYQRDSYVAEELLACGTTGIPARGAALEGALERGDLRMTGILLSSGILSELSPADAAAVLGTALGDGETNDLLWCSLRVVTEHWDEVRKKGILDAMQGRPELIHEKTRTLFGIAKPSPPGNVKKRTRWSWF